MNKLRKLAPKTTYQKMILGFLLFGVLPLMVLGVIYFARYQKTAERVMIENYTQINEYFAKNTEDIIDSADEALGRLYDYSDESGLTVSSVLESDEVNDSQREMVIHNALQFSMESSPYIASERFCDQVGRVYSLYVDQDKVLRMDQTFTSLRELPDAGKDIRDLKVMETMPEESICVRSDDYIFSLSRNYMDISNIKLTKDRVLGTAYADINISILENVVDSMNVENGVFYIYNPSKGHYLYAEDPHVYRYESNPLSEYRSRISGENGLVSEHGKILLYRQLDGTDLYSVLLLNKHHMMGPYFQGRIFMILILCFVIFALMLLYMWFSNRLMAPAKQLKAGMEEVQKGNMGARVEIHTADEMEDIAEGFNQMAADLERYINRVYVAEIMRRDAELNALRMQIQPHYLYNTLDVIRMTALEQEDPKTARMLESLAFQLRYVMGSHTDRARLGDELKMLEEYFVIMRVRYEDRIALHIDVDEEDRALWIPKLILQPMIENAIRHGLRPKKEGGTIEIRTIRKENDLNIVLMDNGVGIDADRLAYVMDLVRSKDITAGVATGEVSVGMKNVYDRIRINCGEAYGYDIESIPGVGTIVTYHLPVWLQEDEGNNRGEKDGLASDHSG